MVLQVEMELLHPADWKCLDDFSIDELADERLQTTVSDALKQVHCLPLPGDDKIVLADCRPCNIMLRCTYNVDILLRSVFAMCLALTCLSGLPYHLLHWSPGYLKTPPDLLQQASA